MGILKTAADLVYTIRFLKLLVTPFEKLGAYEAGIIDKDGKKNPDFNTNSADDRAAYRKHYTPFIRLVINLKRIMSKAPGGQSIVARYGAALLLIREHGELNNKQIKEIHEATGIDILDCLVEETKWFMLEGDNLSPGVYRMKYDTITTQLEEVVNKNDQIRVTETSPVGEELGINIYKGQHLNSGQNVYFSTAEITK